MAGFLRDLIVRFVESRTLVILLVVVTAMWAFMHLADEVGEGDTRSFDEAVLLSLRTPGDPSQPIGGRRLEQVARDVTALGGVTLITAITVAVCILLVLLRRGRAALFLAAAVIGGSLFTNAFKELFSRPRPDFVPHDILVDAGSFPSGHAMLATVVYLTLATMLARVSERRSLKAYYFAVAILVALAVGVSRVYLGVHWPTDVVAGWSAGTAWALGMWLVARWLQRKGTIELPSDEVEAPRPGIDTQGPAQG